MIYVVSMYYHPVSNPPAHRMDRLVKLLVSHYGKDQVCVVTGRPNYPTGYLPPCYRWRLFKTRTGPHGETVHHLYEIPAPFRGLYRKTLGLLSFALSVFVYFSLRRIKAEDLVIVTSGPVFPAYAILVLSYLKRRMRFVVDVRDLWPQVVVGMGFLREDGRIYQQLMRLSDLTYRRALALVGNSSGICDYLSSVVKREVAFVFNPIDETVFRPAPRDEVAAFRASKPELFPGGKAVTFVFTGTFSYYIGIATYMEALAILKTRTLFFRAVLIGQGEEESTIQALVLSRGLQDHVKTLPFMERAALVEYICAADCCFASLRDSPSLRYAVPTKIIEYLACDQLVVAALAGPFADMLRRENAAIVCPPGNPHALADALEKIVRDRDKEKSRLRPRAFADRYFSAASFDAGFVAFFRTLVVHDSNKLQFAVQE